MTPDLVTLDLATNVGWARLKGEEISYGSYRLPKTGDDVGRFLVPFQDWLTVFASGAHTVVFEAPFVGGKTSQNTARKLLGLAAMTELREATQCWTISRSLKESPHRLPFRTVVGCSGQVAIAVCTSSTL